MTDPSDFLSRARGEMQQKPADSQRPTTEAPANKPNRKRPLTNEQQKLVTDNIGIAIKAAKSCNISPLGATSEARAEALLALTLAAQSYDPASGVLFSTWAYRKCRWHLLSWMDDEARRNRRYLISDDDVTDSRSRSPETHAHDRLLDAALRDAVDDCRASRLIGSVLIDGYEMPRAPTNSDMAATLGVSRPAVEELRASGKQALLAVAIVTAEGRQN